MPGAVIKSKKIIAALLTLALLAFLLSGQACAAPKRYKDAEHGFSFSYPETWVQRDFFVNSAMVSTSQTDSATANFAVNVSPPLEMAEMTEEAIAEGYEMIMSDVEILSYKVIKLGGVPCIAVDMLFSMGKQHTRARQQMYMANHKGKGYVLVFTTSVKDYVKCEDSFKMILDSFKF